MRGDHAKKRGIPLGDVESITHAGVRLTAAAPIKPGDGVVFDGDERTGGAEQGGRVYQVVSLAKGGHLSPEQDAGPGHTGSLELRFGRGDIDLLALEVGQRVWKTDDPELTRRLRRSFEGAPARPVELDIEIRAVAGEPLSILGRTSIGSHATRCNRHAARARRNAARLTSISSGSRSAGLVARPISFASLEATIAGSPMVPKSVLNQLRRDLVARLDDAASSIHLNDVTPEPALPRLLEPIQAERSRQLAAIAVDSPPVELAVLCRRTEQIEAALGMGISTIYADYQDIKQYAAAIEIVRRGGSHARVYLATPRIEKPGESSIFAHLARQGADGILVRNAGGLLYCAEHHVPFIVDFSLNAANPLTVELFMSRGASSDGIVRPERRTALRPAGCHSALVARGRHPSARSDVPYGTLRLLCVSLARHGRDQLRAALRRSRREAA